MYRSIILICALAANIANAHQFMPTYPEFQTSHVGNVDMTNMQLFNKRADVSFYEISVFDKNWQLLPFASQSKIYNIKYLETKMIPIYIKQSDRKNVGYICSQTKIIQENLSKTIVNSRVCSKVK